MKIHIKLAETGDELDQLLRVRHEVFCREQRYMPEQVDGRLVDRFDAFPGTFNVVAKVDGVVVGGVRVTDAGPLGIPAQDYFDFSGHVPPGAHLASGSMFAVLPRYRRDRLPLAITALAYHWLFRRGVTDLAIIASPLSEKGFLASGYRACSPRFHHAASGLTVIPMVLSLPRDLEPSLAAFVDRLKAESRLDVGERALLAPGDTLFARGDVVDAVYVILDGRVGLVEGDEVRAELGPGAPLGEASMLLGEPSSHTAIALSPALVMVVPREVFLARVKTDGEAAVESLRLFAAHRLPASPAASPPAKRPRPRSPGVVLEQHLSAP